MTERFAKVPAWLPIALKYAIRAPGDAAPATALAAYVELAIRADYRTWRVPIYWPVIADGCGITQRSARRAVALLRRVGALTVDGEWATLHVDNPDTSGTFPGFLDTGVTTIDTSVQDRDTSVTGAPPVYAGQGPDSGTPQRTEFLSESKRHQQRVIQSPLLALAGIPDDEVAPMPRSVREQLDRTVPRLREEDRRDTGSRMRNPGTAGVADEGESRVESA